MLLGFVTIVSLFMLFRLSLYIHFNKHEMCFLETVLCYLSLLLNFPLSRLSVFKYKKKTLTKINGGVFITPCPGAGIDQFCQTEGLF